MHRLKVSNTLEEKLTQALDLARESLQNRDKIGTQSERMMHSTLKYFFEQDDEFHEVKVGRYFADIFKDNHIYEVQTRQLGSLRKKLDFFLEDYQVTVIHPIHHNKWLTWVDPETGNTSKRRKSPKTGNEYSAFRELYRIKAQLKHPNLRLKLVLIDVDEFRILNGWSKDRKKGSHRMESIPISIVDIVEINSPADYIKLIPANLPKEYTTKDYRKAAKITQSASCTALNILHHMNVTERVGKVGNAYLYKTLDI